MHCLNFKHIILTLTSNVIDDRGIQYVFFNPSVICDTFIYFFQIQIQIFQKDKFLFDVI